MKKIINTVPTWLDRWYKMNFTDDVKEIVAISYIDKDYEFVHQILVAMIEREYSTELDWLISMLPMNQIEV